MDSVDTSYVPAESVPTHYGSYPVQDNPMEQEPVYSPPIRQPPPYPWPQAPPPMHTEQYERKEMYEAGSWSRRDESQHWDQRRKERHQDQYSRYDRGRPEDQSPEYDEHVSSDYATSRGSGGSQDYYGKRPKWNRDWQGNNQTPEGVIAIPMALSAKRPHTPPAPAAQPAYRLRALSYLDELSAFDIESAEPDSAPMLEVLQGLYNLTLANIGNIGKSSVVHVVSQAGYLDILLKLIKKKETKKRSPSRGYVSDIISLCFKFTSSVTFAQKYCTEICDLVAANFPEMQDVQLWLKPYKDMSNEVAAACEILKSSVDSCTALPPKIICAIRLLKFLSIPKSDRDLCPMQFDGEYDELKYKFNVLQIYSLDGLTSLTLMLQKLTKHYEQPYLYSSRLIGRQGLLLVAFVLPAVQLLRRMLIYVIQVRNTEFKDLTAVPVLLQTFALMQAVPINGQAHTDALRVCREIVETLLAYTQPIYSKDSSENDALNKSLWTQMMSEVLKYTIEYPTNFVSGLMVLSELLPLPLPLQCRVALLPAEATKLANSRRLWSAHLHSLSSLLESMIALTSMSNCHPLLQILRRVCVQLSDLAAPTAQIVVRTLCDAILPLLEPPKMDSSLPRLLNFLARLMTHGSIKATFLFIVNTIEKYQSMITLMTDIFK
ncbi:unnamed protein product [Nesidiocoris tenuis]|uniref:Uncharacterized protein n=1 Tax=Nesidiocoris tenuis TaxID=355587 RepID=A0A6H5HMG6_9HEMI|nr:unnamed protein product [Nesidiocoris tenuis]